MISEIKNYLSLIKFSHTIFAMPFAVVGYLLGLKYTLSDFEILLFLKIVLCMVFARSAAMAFNRYADRYFDKDNPRTFVREIPSGIISAKSALFFVIINAVLFVITTFFINSLCFYLSPVALFVILGYSYTKRFTPLCHLFLGLGLSLAPIGAYLSVTESFSLIPILFSLTVFFWVTGFDIIYALQDVEFDSNKSLKSIPVVMGKEKALLLARSFHIFSLAFLVFAGLKGEFGILYTIGVSVFGLMLVYQHLLVKPNDLSKVNLAFFTTNGIASVVFSLFFIAEFIFKL